MAKKQQEKIETTDGDLVVVDKMKEDSRVCMLNRYQFQVAASNLMFQNEDQLKILWENKQSVMAERILARFLLDRIQDGDFGKFDKLLDRVIGKPIENLAVQNFQEGQNINAMRDKIIDMIKLARKDKEKK